MESIFKNAKVDNIVYYIDGTEGEIICTTNHSNRPIKVNFCNSQKTFTLEGYSNLSDHISNLFYSKPDILSRRLFCCL